MGRISRAGLTALVSLAAGMSHAGDRLTATGGVTQIEGSAGGGLTPWALIAGYGTEDQVGGSAFLSGVRTRGGFTLATAGVAMGIHNRVELSLAKARFGLSDTVPGQSLRMSTAGVKVRLHGDAIYDQDRWMPQISVGLQLKHNDSFRAVPAALGARDATGVDAYLAASKLYLAGLAGRNVLLNASLHATRANQFGLLGFGGDRSNSYRLKPAASAAVFLQDNLAVGMEYRDKPNQLSAFAEEAASSAFIAWFPAKNLSLTMAYVNLGNIANKPNQDAIYLSAQALF